MGRWTAGLMMAVGVAAGAGLLSATERPVAAGEDAGTEAFYTSRVQPIFQQRCYSCHGGMNHRGGFNMQTRAGMLKGGKEGVVVVPGDPAGSLLVRLMRHEGPANDPMPMPPAPRPKATDAEIETVTQWVKAGAVMPADVPKP